MDPVVFDIAERWFSRTGEQSRDGRQNGDGTEHPVARTGGGDAAWLLAGGERRLGLSDIASLTGPRQGHGPRNPAHPPAGGVSWSRTTPPAATSWARSCCVSAPPISTCTNCARGPWCGWTTRPAPAARACTWGVLHQQGVLIVHHVFRPDDSRQVLEIGAHAAAALDSPGARSPRRTTRWRTARRWTPSGRPSRTARCATPPTSSTSRHHARAWVRAADVEETWEGVASIAAPIHDRRRMPVGAVGITGAVERLCRGRRAAPGADRGGARLRPRGLPGPGRRTVLTGG